MRTADSPAEQWRRTVRTRCASCHSLGPQDGEGIGMRNIGPDLIGVTRQRDPAMAQPLDREPDRMLAEKDPIAMELYEQYDTNFDAQPAHG
jgi:protein SCO1/2